MKVSDYKEILDYFEQILRLRDYADDTEVLLEKMLSVLTRDELFKVQTVLYLDASENEWSDYLEEMIDDAIQWAEVKDEDHTSKNNI